MLKKLESILETELGPAVEAEGLALVDVEVSQGGHQRLIRLFVDKQPGVGVDDCSRIARRVGPLIDALELFEGRYVLEVSSPGVTRALKKDRDYVLFAGRLARLNLSEEIEGRMQWIGDLRGMEGADVLFWPLSASAALRIPLALIRSARLEYETPDQRAARQDQLPREVAAEPVAPGRDEGKVLPDHGGERT